MSWNSYSGETISGPNPKTGVALSTPDFARSANHRHPPQTWLAAYNREFASPCPAGLNSGDALRVFADWPGPSRASPQYFGARASPAPAKPWWRTVPMDRWCCHCEPQLCEASNGAFGAAFSETRMLPGFSFLKMAMWTAEKRSGLTPAKRGAKPVRGAGCFVLWLAGQFAIEKLLHMIGAFVLQACKPPIRWCEAIRLARHRVANRSSVSRLNTYFYRDLRNNTPARGARPGEAGAIAFRLLAMNSPEMLSKAAEA